MLAYLAVPVRFLSSLYGIWCLVRLSRNFLAKPKSMMNTCTKKIERFCRLSSTFVIYRLLIGHFLFTWSLLVRYKVQNPFSTIPYINLISKMLHFIFHAASLSSIGNIIHLIHHVFNEHTAYRITRSHDFFCFLHREL